MDNYIFGVEPDAPVIENKNGGKHSASPYGFDLIPPGAIFSAAKVLRQGADKYGETRLDRNYTKLSVDEHLNHALQHIFAYLAGDNQDDHLTHALCRLMFACDLSRPTTSRITVDSKGISITAGGGHKYDWGDHKFD